MMKRIILLLVLCSCFFLPAQAQRTSQHRIYDDNDRLAVLITYTYDTNNVVETRQLQSFDKFGRLTRTELYTADEHLLFSEDIRYDRHGNRSRCLQTTYDEEGVPARADYRYKYSQLADGTWELRSIRLNNTSIYSKD